MAIKHANLFLNLLHVSLKRELRLAGGIWDATYIIIIRFNYNRAVLFRCNCEQSNAGKQSGSTAS
jgi:hypothetical protein